MNDPNKAIDVNLSSLLSLKAELLRKQAEVSKTKASRTPDEHLANIHFNKQNRSSETSSKREKKLQNCKPTEIINGGDAIVYEHEDSLLLEKSQRVLEAKSKYYERMSRTGGHLNSDDNCLVLFNRKRQEEPQVTASGAAERRVSSSTDDSSSSDDDTYPNDNDEEDDWVEYTDCLGRTRKCQRNELAEMKRRDAELAASMPERLDQSKPNWLIDKQGTHNNEADDDDDANDDDKDDNDDDMVIGPLPTESIFSDGCSLISKHDEQRANWDRKEQENLTKPDVHYQDVFFDEARQHGVGYYAFSTDEEERKRQQRELKDARQQTKAEQEHRDALRAQRTKIIAERVLAARNRQRARQGLPPLEADEQQEQQNEGQTQPETKAERKARKRAEKLLKKQEKAEAERVLERLQHVRPWDKEKKGVKHAPTSSTSGFEASSEPEWTYKPERLPMSQEEWNERKRTERNPEFAPFAETSAPPKRTNFSTNMPPPAALPPVTMNQGALPSQFNFPPPPLPVPAPIVTTLDPAFASFQSTKREKHFQKRNYEHMVDANVVEEYERQGATIPPPANLDAAYSLPPHAKHVKTSGELERSIEAGLRFLRNNCDKGTMSTKSSWTAKADY